MNLGGVELDREQVLASTWQDLIIICSILLLSKRLVIYTEEISFYIGTFPHILTSKMGKYYEIRIYFFDKRVRSLSATAITLKLKMRWFPDEPSY